MAKTRATVTGGNRSGTTGTASRLGSEYVSATADTWHTFAELTTWADGRVQLTIRNADRQTMATVELSRERTTDETIAGDVRTLTIDTVPGRGVELEDA